MTPFVTGRARSCGISGATQGISPVSRLSTRATWSPWMRTSCRLSECTNPSRPRDPPTSSRSSAMSRIRRRVWDGSAGSASRCRTGHVRISCCVWRSFTMSPSRPTCRSASSSAGWPRSAPMSSSSSCRRTTRCRAVCCRTRKTCSPTTRSRCSRRTSNGGSPSRGVRCSATARGRCTYGRHVSTG